MMSSKQTNKKRKIPKNQENRKTINKNKLKQKQNKEENLQNKQQDQQITEVKKNQTMAKPKIFNLSNKLLSQQHVNVLCRGLKFTPTPLPNKIELKSYAPQFSRKLRLLEFFYKEDESKEEESSDDSIIKTKSAFSPPRNRDKILEQSIDSINSLNFPNLQKAPKSNLSKLKLTAISDLQNDKNIEIKEVDKGGSVVILSKSHYKSMALAQLNDEKTYKKLNLNPDQAIMKKIKALITKYKPLLTDSEYKYLSHNYFETNNFHGHPKIHKSETLHKAIKEQNKELITILETKDLKLRPIVGVSKCSTRVFLSNFLDLILKPPSKHAKSNINDNIELLKTCKRNVTDDTVLVTFDVYSLYTNIPHEFGLRAIEYFISNCRQSVNPRFTTQFILEAASFILSIYWMF